MKLNIRDTTHKFSTLFIIPYFGKWPFWIDFFFKSCAKNSNYSWLFYTDCTLKDNLPKNVSIKPCSFEAYKQLVSNKLDISFKPESPYKLCDIKPALGYIHKKDTIGYDFIAFGDIDLIYGDLDTFLTERKFQKYDIISTHSRRVSGHLCVMRNENSTLQLFKKVPNWKKLLSDPNHRHFDEKSFSDIFIKHKNFPDKLRKLICKAYPLSRRISLEEAYSTPFMKIPWINGKPSPNIWYWKDGSLTTDSDLDIELPYYHFLHWKNNQWAELNNDSLISDNIDIFTDGFSISKVGFRKY